MLLKLQIAPDPNKHIVLTSVKRLESDVFYNDLHSELDSRGSNILVFIHGYNVSFEDAARRTAQMSYDLKFPGAPVFYSWPSQANWYRYRTDQENIENSVEQIKGFLLELADRSHATTINLVAHSMGNVGLTTALSRMEGPSRFHQIVLAAPDIDALTFKQEIAPKIITQGKRVTLYTSKTDLALIASKYFNHGARAGDSGAEMPLIPGIETIDATAVDSSLLGHSYYGSNINVLFDLGELLSGKPIEARPYLQTAANSRAPYWYFDPKSIANRNPSQGATIRR
jgi:esterase/lipase superfamily enzyme